MGFSAIIEENVSRDLITALAFASWTLEMIDSSQRTQAEQEASPNSGTMGFGGNSDEPRVARGSWARAALRTEAHRLAEDLTVRVRRLWKKR